MNLELGRLSQVDPADLLNLMNDPSLRKHMPLATGDFDIPGLMGWVKGKESIWTEHGYGPWAFLIDGDLAGWGGFQPEDGDIDLALVLRSSYWGSGKVLFDEVIGRGFNEFGFESMTILLPPSRTNVRALSRLGFFRDGETEYSGSRFFRYRLNAPSHQQARKTHRPAGLQRRHELTHGQLSISNHPSFSV